MKQISTLLVKGNNKGYVTLSYGADLPDTERAYRIKNWSGLPFRINLKFKKKQEALTEYKKIIQEKIQEGWQDNTPSFYKS